MIDTSLAGILCARICHDLANPVGAIVNGADLIREVGAADAAAELALLEQSAHRAAALLALHRLAFGNRRDQDAAMTHAQLQERIAAVLSSPRVSLTWNARGSGSIGGAEARLTALMALAGRAILGLTGELAFTWPEEAALPVSVCAMGARAAVTEQQRGWLGGVRTPLPDSRQIEFALVPAALEDAGARLELAEGDGHVTLTATRR